MAAADPSGAGVPAEVDEDGVRASVEGLVFIRLPPPRESEEVFAAVVPADMLVPTPGEDSEQMAIRAVFPLPAASEGDKLELMALIDRPSGTQLVRLSALAQGPVWRNVVAPDYDLDAATRAVTAKAIEFTLASDALPHQAHELTIAPDGSLAAWAAPVGEAPADRPLANFEIFTLALGQDGGAPVQVTDNQRADQGPRFVRNDAGMALVFDTSYAAAEKLPSVDALRVLPL